MVKGGGQALLADQTKLYNGAARVKLASERLGVNAVQKYEYKVLPLFHTDTIELAITQLTADGWELFKVVVVPMDPSPGTKLYHYFKRDFQGTPSAAD